MGASLLSLVFFFNPTDLRQRLHQVGHHLVPVLGQDVVQRGSPLAVLPQHEEAGVLLIGRRRRAVVLEVLHRDAAEQKGEETHGRGGFLNRYSLLYAMLNDVSFICGRSRARRHFGECDVSRAVFTLC